MSLLLDVPPQGSEHVLSTQVIEDKFDVECIERDGFVPRLNADCRLLQLDISAVEVVVEKRCFPCALEPSEDEIESVIRLLFHI